MPKVETWPRDEPCRATARFSEGLYWTCDFAYPERDTRPRNLSEEISDAYGLGQQSYRVVIDGFEVSFSRYQTEDRFRLDDIYSYTNRDRWLLGRLPPAPVDLSPAFIGFRRPERYINDVRSLDGTVEVHHDAPRRRARLNFAPAAAPERWYRLADTVVAATDGAGRLRLLQVEDFAETL